jgi:hypothetical protein
VVVDLRVAQVLVREMAQLFDGGVNVDATVVDGGEKLAEALLVDDVAPATRS